MRLFLQLKKVMFCSSENKDTSHMEADKKINIKIGFWFGLIDFKFF